MQTPRQNQVTEAVCSFAAGLTYDDIPGAIREKVKLHIIDAVGSGIAGAHTSLGRQLLSLTGLEHAAGAVPVLGTDKAFGPAAAAFANAGSMNALDCDDGFEVAGRGMRHPGASIVAACVSGAYGGLPTCGARFLTVVTAAFEVNNRLIYSMQPSIERFRQVYGVCQHQALPCGVAFGLLQGASADELGNILGFAGTLANVPSLRKYNFNSRPIISLKDFNAPAAEAGVRAAQMHAVGLIGSKGVLDGPSGLWRMLGSDQFEPSVLVDQLGNTWQTAGSTLKAYPACRWLHTCLEAFELVVEEHGFTPDEIDKVKVYTSQGMVTDFMDFRPVNMVDAQFSLPYSIAAVSHRFSSFAEWFDDEALGNRQLHAFAEKVEAIVDPIIDELMREKRRPAGRVEILARGKVFGSSLVEYAIGSPQRPMSARVVHDKFLSNAVPIVGDWTASELLARLIAIDTEANMRDVLSLATIGSAASP